MNLEVSNITSLLELSEQKRGGKYGRLHLEYLKAHSKGLYTNLLSEGTLNQQLCESAFKQKLWSKTYQPHRCRKRIAELTKKKRKNCSAICHATTRNSKRASRTSRKALINSLMTGFHRS